MRTGAHRNNSLAPASQLHEGTFTAEMPEKNLSRSGNSSIHVYTENFQIFSNRKVSGDIVLPSHQVGKHAG